MRNLEGLKIGWQLRVDAKKNRIKKSCKTCNKSFEVRPSLDRIKFCSRACFGISLRGRVSPMKGKTGLRGEKGSNWKGGVTASNQLERSKFRDTMQKEVFERDDYTCQLCGIRGQNMQVDHIQSWADYADLRFSMDNCRTLCQQCHYQITFGKPMPKDVKTWGQNLKQIERMVS